MPSLNSPPLQKQSAREIIEIANASEPYMDGRIPIERINGPFLY